MAKKLNGTAKKEPTAFPNTNKLLRKPWFLALPIAALVLFSIVLFAPETEVPGDFTENETISEIVIRNLNIFCPEGTEYKSVRCDCHDEDPMCMVECFECVNLSASETHG